LAASNLSRRLRSEGTRASGAADEGGGRGEGWREAEKEEEATRGEVEGEKTEV